MVKIYKQPFAHDGDAVAIPDASQPDGKMSGADGWTPDYQLPKTDPNYKPVGRQEMNGVFKEVTEALGQVQVQGAASWSADGAPYPINAQVYHNGKQWIALRANSVSPAEGEDWSAIGTAATRDVGESAGDVMEVGAFGLGANIPISMTSRNGFFSESVSGGANGTPSSGAGFISTYNANRRGMIFIGTDGSVFARFSTSVDTIDTTTPWEALIARGNLRQETGTSTIFPMSQKAVTDAIKNSSIGVGQTWQNMVADRAFGTTYTNTTGRPIAVSVSHTASGSSNNTPGISITVGGVLVSTGELTTSGGSSGSVGYSANAIVPVGSTYVCALLGSASNRVVYWAELR